jgi:hypothetical protein
MTHSKEDLLANETLALELIGRHCMNDAIGQAHEKDLENFKPIFPTTWEALANQDYVRFSTIWWFQLTPSGWIKAQEAIGTLCTPEMEHNLGQIAKRLKDQLEGRSEPVPVEIDKIVRLTGFSHDWVFNVIDSHLIRYCLRQIDADWAPDDEGMKGTILVPMRIGHKLY